MDQYNSYTLLRNLTPAQRLLLIHVRAARKEPFYFPYELFDDLDPSWVIEKPSVRRQVRYASLEAALRAALEQAR